MLLDVREFAVGYDCTRVCDGVTLSVDRGEVVCVLGRNGVGKSTLLKGLIGLQPAMSGTIRFADQPIETLPSHRRARLGMAYVPQGRMVFPRITVAENLLGGTLIGRGGRFRAVNEVVFEYFPVLKSRLEQPGGTLSGGEQQMLAIGRALAGEPRLLLLDEPSEGIQPSIVQEIRAIIGRIAREQGLGILLIEQNLKFATGAASRGYVLDKGRIVAKGSVAELMQDRVVSEHLAFVEAPTTT